MSKVLIDLTTFVGRSFGATYYYASVSYYLDGDYHREKIKRPITQSEIKADEDRFYGYKTGDLTECFSSWRQAIKYAKEYIESLNLCDDVYVEGVPNNGALTLEQALSVELDTRKKCSKCGKVFAAREGFYNYPSGAVCVNCNKK